MISVGSRGTENYSNEAENSALHYRNKLDYGLLYFGQINEAW